MNIADIQVFSKVAATGSFSEAALQLGITRSAASKAVARLESELGVTLLTRSPRSASLTEAGRTFHAHSLEVDTALERAVASVSGADQRPSGTVSVSLPSSLGATLMLPLMREFRVEWPEIDLNLHFDDAPADLIGSSIDLAIRVAERLGDSNLVSRRIGSTRKVLAASPGYIRNAGWPESIDDLKNHRCLATGTAVRRRVIWRFRGPEGPIETAVDCSTTSNAMLALILAACLDDGIVCMPEIFVAAELGQGRLVELFEDTPPLGEFGVYAVSPNPKPPAKVRALIDFVERQLARIDTLDRWTPLDDAGDATPALKRFVS